MATVEEITSVMKMLGEYYGRPAGEVQARIYVSTLSDLPGPVLETAALDWIAQSEWFPKVAQLRLAAKEVMANNGRTVRYTGPEADRDQGPIYWQAIALLNAALRGELTPAALESDRTFLRLSRLAAVHPPECTCALCRGLDSAQAWDRAREIAAAWLEEGMPAPVTQLDLQEAQR